VDIGARCISRARLIPLAGGVSPGALTVDCVNAGSFDLSRSGHDGALSTVDHFPQANHPSARPRTRGQTCVDQVTRSAGEYIACRDLWGAETRCVWGAKTRSLGVRARGGRRDLGWKGSGGVGRGAGRARTVTVRLRGCGRPPRSRRRASRQRRRPRRGRRPRASPSPRQPDADGRRPPRRMARSRSAHASRPQRADRPASDASGCADVSTANTWRRTTQLLSGTNWQLKPRPPPRVLPDDCCRAGLDSSRVYEHTGV
jgi:hypothetical protein